MLENDAESQPSVAPMMMASDHFIWEDEDLRPENAVLGRVFNNDDFFVGFPTLIIEVLDIFQKKCALFAYVRWR